MHAHHQRLPGRSRQRQGQALALHPAGGRWRRDRDRRRAAADRLPVRRAGRGLDGRLPDLAGHQAKGVGHLGHPAAERHLRLAVGAGAGRLARRRVLLPRAGAVRGHHGDRLLPDGDGRGRGRGGEAAHPRPRAAHLLHRPRCQPLLLWPHRPHEPDHLPGGGPRQDVPRARRRVRALPGEGARPAEADQQHRRRQRRHGRSHPLRQHQARRRPQRARLPRLRLPWRRAHVH
mmetsp:Transcript_36198/g.62166  ORF Transcript_36198/g.62166 Transcript_36198/m.62166 type:complete len:232 (+) Transcript_36198:356-1051(+)